MDFLSKNEQGQAQKMPEAKNDVEKARIAADSATADAQHRPAKSDLLHSAKVVADAAQAHSRSDPGKFDKGEVAGDAADLLNAAAEYGNRDDKQDVGKYVDKAEDCLRHYNSSHAGNPTAKP